MNDFQFEVDANIEHNRREADIVWIEFGIGVIDLDELDNCDEGDDE